MGVIYDDLWNSADVAQWVRSQPTLNPRPPTDLYEMVAQLNLGGGADALDVGCGPGVHACELAARFAWNVTAMDPVASNRQRARERVAQMNLTSQVHIESGIAERLPFPAAAFDLVWCRGVVVHLTELLPAFRECARVLVPGGAMLLQTGFATELLEPAEAAVLRQRLGLVELSLQRSVVEDSIAASGLSIRESVPYGSEFAEWYEEDSGRCSLYLVGIARLQRGEDASVLRFGRAAYETALGMYYWHLYQMIGKIASHAYLLHPSP